ncbi:hypothetical protein PAXRUDRAFT_597949 [Paxillus rubicundulus Ve08.2h10]|uniref:Uncharacterized protein n=1 Tax=Paxillus rubicundulus Ve08.2h10 TaxID=930991 RepID=A0A0D0D5R3_9AGAM|nr:hypothetical protein PAXRUDRAFT_597949 [Paxillus rubicundulus Ve08.2h10]
MPRFFSVWFVGLLKFNFRACTVIYYGVTCRPNYLMGDITMNQWSTMVQMSACFHLSHLVLPEGEVTSQANPRCTVPRLPIRAIQCHAVSSMTPWIHLGLYRSTFQIDEIDQKAI